MSARLRLPCALGLLVASLAFAAPAQGSSVEGANGQLRYSADEGEANKLTVRPNGGEFEVTDSGAQIAVGPGCRQAGAVVRCLKSRLVEVELGDVNDVASVTGFPDGFQPRVTAGPGNDALSTGFGAQLLGGSGDDVLEGGPGADTLSADADFNEVGSGNDTIRASGGGRDFIDCGPGSDSAQVDASDVAPGSSGRGAQVGARDEDGGCEGGALVRPALINQAGKFVGVSRRSRVIRVPVKCSKSDCFGKLRLVGASALDGRGPRVRFSRRRTARVRFKRGRRSGTVRVRLSRRERAGLRRLARGDLAELVMTATLRDKVGHRQRSGTAVYLP